MVHVTPVGQWLPGTPADASAIAATREDLVAFDHLAGTAVDGAALADALTARYPDNGMPPDHLALLTERRDDPAAKDGPVRGLPRPGRLNWRCRT